MGLLLTVALLMVLGAAVDIGHAFIVRRDLTSLADDAALAGAQQLDPQAIHEGQLALDPQQAQAAALATLSGQTGVQAQADATSTDVHVQVTRRFPTILLGLRRTLRPHRLRPSQRRSTRTMTTRALIAATAGGASFGAVGVLAGADPLAVVRLTVLGAALLAAAFFDLTERRIPNRIVVPAAAACGALTLAAGAPLSLLAGIATVLLLLIVSLRWPAALGMGDVKLALLLVLGLDGDALRALTLSLALAAISGAALVIRRGRAAWTTSLPLAPFLATGALLAVIA